MPPRSFAPGRLAPGLRIGSHNVRGLSALSSAGRDKVCALHAQWRRLRWPIVCVQETWLCGLSQTAVERVLHSAATGAFVAPYTAFWAHCAQRAPAGAGGGDEGGDSPSLSLASPPSDSPSQAPPPASQPPRQGAPSPPAAGGRRTAGVGILIDSGLLASGVVQLLGEPERHASGRIISVRLAWEGHKFTLCCVYLPSSDPAGQRAFIAQHVQPLAARCRDLVVVGDWNWVPNVARDRFSRAALPPGGLPAQPAWQREADPARVRAHADTRTSAQFAAACPGLVDVFRHRHPGRAAYTYHSSTAASRLDRFYASSSMMPHVESCGVDAETPSDHRPVYLHLRPRRARGFGKGTSAEVRRRVRLHHCSVPELAAEMTVWLRQRVGPPPEGSPGDGAPPPPGVARMPADDAGLLAWWPGFKQDLAAKARELDARAVLAAAARPAALAEAAAALEAAGKRVERGEDGALPGFVEKRRQYASAARAAAEGASDRARHEWLHAGERPCPLLTAMTRPPASSRHIPCLRAEAGGGLLVSGPLMAERMATFFAAISTAPEPCPADEEAVLAALRAEGRRVDRAQAVGDPVVSVEAVGKALKAAKQGKAPGPDGLPPHIWRRYGGLMAPALAAVFSAIGRLGAMPVDFTLGVIRGLPKPVMPDPTSPGYYRPITLLNSDYRLLAKVLANRLGPALAGAIEAAQTAFLPERQIGENILFLQLLPELLRSGAAGDARSAAVAFLDFQKAYDTVGRPFLFAAMEAMGAGEGLLRWVRLLLSDTRAAADVNGWVSAPVPSTAGVRQGCPLSPALYLFVAQALFSFLRSRGHGITVGDRQLLGAQFADDGQVLLPSAAEEHVAPFLGSMDVFGRASGQRLNLGKCQLLPVGAVALAPAGAVLPAVCGLPVVSSATALGMQFSNDGNAAGTDWEARLAGVEACYGRLARLPLSVFGRALGASGYGVSKLLYHAEFSTWPDSVLHRLHSVSVKLVDRGMAPASRGRALPGVPSQLLAGSPRDGGFGLLPWLQHVRSRHARWGARLLEKLCCPADDPHPPWVVAASATLAHLSGGGSHPALVWLAVLGQRDLADRALLPPFVAQGNTQAQLPAGPLLRMARGLQALGPLQRKDPLPGADEAAAMPWVGDAPLWGNPLLRDLPQPCLAGIPGMNTVSGALEWWEGMQPWMAAAPPGLWPGEHQRLYEAWLRDRLGPRLGGDLVRHLVLDRGMFGTRLTEVHDAVPAAWWAAATAARAEGVGAQQQPGAALAALCGGLGWKREALDPAGPAGWVPLEALTVRAGTELQLHLGVAMRRSKHAAFIAAAVGGEAAEVTPEQLSTLRATLARAWALKWENQQKEVLWRMTVQGVRGVAAHGLTTAHPCPCGGLAAGACAADALRHHFWSCPVAAAVVGELQRGWEAGEGALAPGVPPLRREEVWLLAPPLRPGVGPQQKRMHGSVWMVVCLAALTAMDMGRRALVALHMGREEERRREEARRQQGGGGRQQSLHEAWGLPVPAPPPGPPLVPEAARKAKARFWALMADFAELQQDHKSWASLPEAGHPFLVRFQEGVSLVLPP